jgi:hypothetical protein
MKESTDARAAKFVRPKFGQMVKWNQDCHG